METTELIVFFSKHVGVSHWHFGEKLTWENKFNDLLYPVKQAKFCYKGIANHDTVQYFLIFDCPKG